MLYLSDVTLTCRTSEQALVYNGTKFVNQTSTGAKSLVDLSDVTLTSPTSGQALVYNGTKFVNQTSTASESIAGSIKISTTAQVTAGTDNTTAVSPAKLTDILKNTYGINKSGFGYVRYADGTQICYGSGTISTSQIATASALLNAFPLAFSDIPVVNVVHLGSDAIAGSNIIIDSSAGGHNELTGWKARTTYPVNIYCRYIAIGKWK